jgi:hypothetical protein
MLGETPNRAVVAGLKGTLSHVTILPMRVALDFDVGPEDLGP